MDTVKEITRQCAAMKLKALDMALSTGSNGCHIGGGFSAMEIMACLYHHANVGDMASPRRDRIILSKGHGVLALYTALWQKGMIDEALLDTFDTDGTLLHGHPHRDLSLGLEFSAGSLGLGLSYAVGVALSCQRRGLSNRIYAIVGDGECNEGIVWEALMSAAHFGLDNLTVIVDRNKMQLDGNTAEVMATDNLRDKLTAFGLDIRTVDGHSIPKLLGALSVAPTSGKPMAIIADTIKAHGISFLENNKMAHQCALPRKKYEIAVKEIKEAYGLE